MQRLKRRLTRSGLWVIVAALSACTKAENEYKPPPPPEVTIARPVIKSLPETLEATARTRGMEEVEIRARVKGFLLQKHTDGGGRVKEGDLLFTIDPREYAAQVKQAEADLAARQADLALAELTLVRVNDAFRQQAAAQFEVDKAEADRNAAKARVELAEATLTQARLNLEFTEVRAPISGRLSLVNVDEGQLVGANEATLLATIINDSKVYAEYDLDERTVLDLRERNSNRRPNEDGRSDLVVNLGLANDLNYPHPGKFHRADNQVDPATGTIRVEAIFDNPTGTILPGLFARVQAVFAEREVMLVPDVAVLTDQGGRFVLVVNEQNIVERRNVTVGPVSDRMRIIRDGLDPGARVVVNGVQRARPGAPVTPKEAAHEPVAPTPQPAK